MELLGSNIKKIQETETPKQLFIFQEIEILKKLLIFWEMELFSPPRENFLYFRKQKPRKNKAVTGKTPFSVIGPFCSYHFICLTIGI